MFLHGAQMLEIKRNIHKGFPWENSSLEMQFATSFVEHVQDKPLGC